MDFRELDGEFKSLERSIRRSFMYHRDSPSIQTVKFVEQTVQRYRTFVEGLDQENQDIVAGLRQPIEQYIIRIRESGLDI